MLVLAGARCASRFVCRFSLSVNLLRSPHEEELCHWLCLFLSAVQLGWKKVRKMTFRYGVWPVTYPESGLRNDRLDKGWQNGKKARDLLLLVLFFSGIFCCCCCLQTTLYPVGSIRDEIDALLVANACWLGNFWCRARGVVRLADA